jgi:hypothetical protein
MNEKKLTPELLAKLSKITGFDLEADFDYVPKVFREKDSEGKYVFPKETWAVFKLRSKDGLEVADAEDNAGYIEYNAIANTSIFHPHSGASRLDTLEKGIVVIKNLPLENGSILSYNKAEAKLTIDNKIEKEVSIRDVLKYLKATLQVELHNAINEKSTLTEEELSGL